MYVFFAIVKLGIRLLRKYKAEHDVAVMIF